MTWAVGQRAGSPGHKAVLLALANRAGVESWACWPSQGTIALETEQSERTVWQQLRELEELGLIARERRYRDGHRTTDLIRLTPPPLSTGVPADSASSEDSYSQDPPSYSQPVATRNRQQEQEVLTSETSFTTREPESECSLSLDEARRRLREGIAAERVERERLKGVPDTFRDHTEPRAKPEPTEAAEI